jgi:hypothetical protein
MKTVVHTFRLDAPKKHSIRAACVSDRKIPDIYVPNSVLEALGANAGQLITVTYQSTNEESR